MCPAGAQCAHAAVGVIGMYKSGNEALFRHWERHGQPKIALKIRDDQEMVRASIIPVGTQQSMIAGLEINPIQLPKLQHEVSFQRPHVCSTLDARATYGVQVCVPPPPKHWMQEQTDAVQMQPAVNSHCQ